MKRIASMISRRLRSQRGETLIELLVSILVVVLAATALATMTAAAGRINTTTRQTTEAMYREVGEVEMGKGSPIDGATVKISGGNKDITIDVDAYQSGDFIYYESALNRPGGEE